MLYNPYSVSRFGTYETCPKKFKLSYIDHIKIDGEPRLALERGSYVHRILEHNFNYDIDVKLNKVFNEEEKEKVIKILKEFEVSELGIYIKNLIQVATLEEDFAFNNKLELVNFKDRNAWMRGSADVYHICKDDNTKGIIIDYKTGKDKSEDESFGILQATVYAVYMFLKFPNLLNVKASFVFIEHCTKKDIYFNREDFNSYIKEIFEKTIKIEKDTNFNESVSALCPYCDYNETEYCSSYEDNIKKTEQALSSKISLDF